MTRGQLPVVLVLSGSDPSGGAGLEADLKTLHQHGVYGMAIPTLLTAQNTQGVHSVRYLDPDFVEQQWKTLFEDIRPTVIKIGALGSGTMVKKIYTLLRKPNARGIPVVLDPVMVSTSGKALIEKTAIPDLLQLFPLCRVITPNANEFSLLSGQEVNAQNALTGLRTYMSDKKFGVLLKGGHLQGTESIDYLGDKERIYRFHAPRLSGTSRHGTGCVFASAIAAHLCRNSSLVSACRSAKEFVHHAYKTAPNLGKGRGPLNLWVRP